MILYLLLSVVIFASGIVIAWHHRNELQKMSLSMTVAISFAVTVLTFPFFAGRTRNLLYAFLAALKYGTSILSMGVNEDVIYSMQLEEPLFTIYNILLSAFYILGPIFASIFLIGFSRSIVEFLRFGRFRQIHVFSELNERSVTIAQSLYERNPNELRVFCASRNAPDALKSKAALSHSLITDKEITALHLLKSHTYEFYEIQDDPDRIFPQTTELLKHLNQKGFTDSVIRVFISHSHFELLREYDERFSKDGSSVQIRYIDENAAEAIELYSHMIRLLPVGIPDYEYKILLIGCGDTGASIFRTSASLMILPKSHVTFHIVDRNARNLIACMKAEAPEYFNAPIDAYLSSAHGEKNYDVVFHSFDAESSQLLELLDEIGTPDLSVVAIHEDLTNHRIARRILRHLTAKSDTLEEPLIAARVRSNKSISMIESNSPIYYFGSMEKHYSYDRLIHPQLEEAARQVHLAYYQSAEWTPEIEAAFYRYVNSDSSFTQALSMFAKRRYILSSRPEGIAPEEWIRQVLDDPERMEWLGSAEHNRWNAYQRIHGWRRATLPQVEAIVRKTDGRQVKDDSLLLHPAIVPYKELAATEAAVDQIRRLVRPDAPSVNYINADRNIIRALPVILKSEDLSTERI